MKRISLSQYRPIISDKDVGEEIYELIKTEVDSNDIVEIDLTEIRSMATYCAKQIFGRLYIELGPSNFFERVLIKGASNDLKTIIKIGIQESIKD